MSAFVPPDAVDDLVGAALRSLSLGAPPAAALRLLDDAFAGDGMLEYALACADRGRVACLVGPSGRCVYTVSSSIGKQQPSGGGYDLALSGLRDGAFYVCVSGVCSCYEYGVRLRVVEDQLQRFSCKHVLAVEIAKAAGKCISRDVSDTEVARLLDFPVF